LLRSFRVRSLVALLVGAALAVPLVVASPVPPVARAADASAFDPGHIISDAQFYDGQAMNAQEVQDFLVARVPNCQPWRDAYPETIVCMKDFVQWNLTPVAADEYCEAFPGASAMSAAEIIATVGRICGISQKALLVTLEKEMSLVTHTWPSPWRYAKAMGYACPDTAPCDASFGNFFYQIYYAARQFERYRLHPEWFNYRVGGTYDILYNPNRACGTKQITIRSAATAGLYNYTPYTPNAAALANLYGTGDSCSAYGNRNFWRIYSDWFGNPAFAAYDYIQEAWAASGGAGGPAGAAVGDVVCGLAGGGCYRPFAHGRIYWSAAGGAHFVPNAEVAAWANIGGEGGWLGYPTTDYLCGLVQGGCYQVYTGGVLYTWPGGIWSVRGAVHDRWAVAGKEWGSLGYPRTHEIPTPAGGTYQDFERGRIYWSPSTGARLVLPETLAVLSTVGWIGHPTNERQCGLLEGGCAQSFERGVVVTSTAGTFVVRDAIASAWNRSGAEEGALGYPVGAETTAADGTVSQAFERGRIVSSRLGAFYMPTATVAALASFPWLGHPASDHLCGLADEACYQVFEGGSLYTSLGGVWPVRGGVRDGWIRSGSEHGPAGYPLSDERATPGGVYQEFEGGRMYWSATTGARFVPSATVSAVESAGGTGGWLGFPTDDHRCGLVGGGCYQVFRGGVMYTSTNGVWPVRGGVFDAWAALGKEWGRAGYPKSSEIPIAGGVYQEFENGRIYWSAATGARFVPTAFAAALSSFPWLGFPTSESLCGLVGGGCYQVFQTGTLYSSSNGVWPVRGGIRDAWRSLGSEWGVAGYPKSHEIAADGGVYQEFEGGRMTWTPAGGATFSPAG